MARKLKREFVDLLRETDESPWLLCRIASETDLLFMLPNVEQMIRKSQEYRVWISAMRHRYGLTTTSDLHAVDTDQHSITAEFHHTPFTLFDLCYVVGMKQLSEISIEGGDFITSFDVAKEAIDLHMRNMVGATLLTKTVHELAHAGLTAINEQTISGQYIKFAKAYRQFIPEDVRMRVEANLGKEIDKL
jgi:hypothetical protein